MAAQVVAHQAQLPLVLLLAALQHQDRVTLAVLPINSKAVVAAVLGQLAVPVLLALVVSVFRPAFLALQPTMLGAAALQLPAWAVAVLMEAQEQPTRAVAVVVGLAAQTMLAVQAAQALSSLLTPALPSKWLVAR
jgi:hypothetical protein